MFSIFSRKLQSLPHLAAFLDGLDAKRETVLGWGHKPTADRARRYAAARHLPYIALEDGFLRSLDLGCNGAAPLSLVIDQSGIYYDAGGPSDLENLLNSEGWESEALLAEAEQALAAIRGLRLSKYNHAPLAAPDLLQKPAVLIIDQTLGDSSVTLGCANAGSFTRMLAEAQREYPQANLYIKTHPDVLAGKKEGYLAKIASSYGATLLAEDVNPLSLLEQADAVFTVTSQMGFEALIAGKPVYCFGLPFYAGWGLTKDAIPCPRRKRGRTLPEIFAAAYILYARYIDPIKDEPCSIHAAIRRLGLQKAYNDANRGFHACFGYSRWKHPHARAFMQSTGAAFAFFKYFFPEKRAIKAALAHGGDIVAWSSKCTDSLARRCKETGISLIRMEDGFIRSIGLGSNFEKPYSLVLDRRGIYYDPTEPSDLETLLNAVPSRRDRDSLCSRAKKLREFIINKGLTKYNLDGERPARANWPAKRVLLVPGQVEDDASVRRGGLEIQSNLALLKRVRALHPNAYILYKPHPDVEVRNRKGKISDAEALLFADKIIRNVRMDALLDAVDEVHTLTSLTGFEALLRGIPVTCYGGPFYAGWGLTTDHAAKENAFFARRTAQLTLDELVAGVLLLYPRYYDWETQSFCTPEDICWRLSQPRRAKRGALELFATLRAWMRK